MSTDRALRIRSSFAFLKPRADELVALFYNKLFIAAPAVRGLFPPDMGVQKRMLLAMLVMVVEHVDQLESIRGQLERLGERHVAYGATPERYPIVRDVLLASMAEIAGSLWTYQLDEDWAETINTIAGMMVDGARREREQAA